MGVKLGSSLFLAKVNKIRQLIESIEFLSTRAHDVLRKSVDKKCAGLQEFFFIKIPTHNSHFN